MFKMNCLKHQMCLNIKKQVNSNKLNIKISNLLYNPSFFNFTLKSRLSSIFGRKEVSKTKEQSLEDLKLKETNIDLEEDSLGFMSEKDIEINSTNQKTNISKTNHFEDIFVSKDDKAATILTTANKITTFLNITDNSRNLDDIYNNTSYEDIIVKSYNEIISLGFSKDWITRIFKSK